MDFSGTKARVKRHREALLTRFAQVLDHGQFILGPEVGEFENALADFLNQSNTCPFVVSCASGTDALRLALMALDIGPGHAVFVPAFGFAAAAEAIVLSGAIPLFVDIDPITFNMDPNDLEKRLLGFRDAQARSKSDASLEVKTVIAIDTFGLPADYAALQLICSQQGLHLIEDAAQSLGAQCQGKPAGVLADMAVTSFYPSKPLGALGDGGAVITRKEDWAERLRRLRDHGQTGKYCHTEIGFNSRLDSLQAAALLEFLPSLKREIAIRADRAHTYQITLETQAKIAGIDPEKLILPKNPGLGASSWSQYTLRVKSRDQMAQSLRQAGIPTAIHYPVSLPEQPAFRRFVQKESSYPVAYQASRDCLSLPLHSALSEEEAIDVASRVIENIAHDIHRV